MSELLTLTSVLADLELVDPDGHATYDPHLWVRIEEAASRLADDAESTWEYATAKQALVAAALQAWASPAPALVSKLPKGKNEDPKSSCSVCGGYHGQRMFHLDYVGHADVTKALLAIDPSWSWEPMALDADGLPRFDRTDRGQPYGLWIRLTVGGMTRLGYGSCDDNKADPEKELIGDAIRNAAMRFGVAVDLWSKAPDADGTRSGAVSRAQATSGGRAPTGNANTAPAGAQAPRKTAWEKRVEELGVDPDEEELRRGLAMMWRDLVAQAGEVGLDEPELPDGLGLVPAFLELDVERLEQLVANVEEAVEVRRAELGEEVVPAG